MKKSRSGYRLIACVLVLVMLLLAGCAEKRSPEAINENCRVVGLEWGLDMETALSELNAAGQEYSSDSDRTISVSGVEFAGMPARVVLWFWPLSENDTVERLTNAEVYFDDSEVGHDALTAALTELFGEPEDMGITAGGELYELSEEGRYWHSDESLLDYASEGQKQQMLAGVSEIERYNILCEGKDMDYVNWRLAGHYLWKLSIVENEQGCHIEITAVGELYRQVLNVQ